MLNTTQYVEQVLSIHGIPVEEEENPFLRKILYMIQRAEIPLKAYVDLNKEEPITIVDPELIKYD